MPVKRAAVGKAGEGIEIGETPHGLIAVTNFRNHAIEGVNQYASLVVGFVFQPCASSRVRCEYGS
jgi:hypothetical protein